MPSHVFGDLLLIVAVVPGELRIDADVRAAEHVAVVKKKSAFPNIVNVGVRFGSELTMWSVCSSTGSAIRSAIGTGTPPWYGSTIVVPSRSRSNFRTPGSVRVGLPFT